MSDRGQVVLITEDEYLIRLCAAEAAADAGFAAVEAGDADEAMQILEQRSDIAVLVTDIQMPGSMDGLALATTVKDRWPEIEVIVASSQAPRRDAELPPHTAFIAKPDGSDELVSVLTQVASDHRRCG